MARFTSPGWIVAAVGLLCATALGAQQRPLPSPEELLAKVRPHLRSDRALLSQYTYLQREREVRISKLGKVELGKEKLFQVYPGLSAEDSYRRLVAVDGLPRDPKELADDDLKHRKRVLETLEPGARDKRLKRQAEETRRDAEQIEDLFRVFDFKVVERQPLAGHSTIVVDFTPRPNAAPTTDVGKMMKKVKGRAWITEDDYEMARVEIEMLDDIAIGLVLGKIYKGTTASFDRRKVNDEIWLPAEVRFKGTGRALVRTFRLDSVVQYSDYRKFSVDTDTTFTVPP